MRAEIGAREKSTMIRAGIVFKGSQPHRGKSNQKIGIEVNSNSEIFYLTPLKSERI